MNHLSCWFVLETHKKAFVCHLEVDVDNHSVAFGLPFSEVLLTLLPRWI